MESASSLCKLPGITECVKILRIGFGLPDNYYVNKLINFFLTDCLKLFMRLSVCLFRSCSSSSDTQALLGIFGNLYFGKKKHTHTHLSVFKNLKLVSYSAAFDFCFA